MRHFRVYILQFLVFCFCNCISHAEEFNISTQAIVDSLKLKINQVQNKEKIDILNQLAYIHGDYLMCDQGIAFGERAYFLAKKIKYKIGQANALYQLTYNYHERGAFYKLKEIDPVQEKQSYEKSFDYASQCIRLSKEINAMDLIVDTYAVMGFNYRLMQKPNEALKVYLKGVAIAKQSKPEKHLEALAYISRMHFFNGDYEKAIQYNFKQVEIVKKLKNKEDLHANILNNIGRAFRENKDYKNALEYFDNAYAIIEKINSPEISAWVLHNIGKTHFTLNKYQHCINYSNKSLKLFESLNNKTGISQNLFILGKANYELKKYLDALQYLKASRNINKILTVPDLASRCLNALGKTHLHLNQTDSAFQCFTLALSISKTMGYRKEIMQTYQQLSDLFIKKREYPKALYHFKNYIKYKDSIYNDEKSKVIAEMQTRYETKKKEQQISLLKAEAKLEARIKWMLISGILGLVLLSSVFGYAGYLKIRTGKQKSLLEEQEIRMKTLALEKSEQEKRSIILAKQKQDLDNLRLQEEIDFKHRELASTTMFIAQKNDVLIQVQDMMKNSINKIDTQTQSELKQMFRMINQNIHLDKDWEQLKLHFEKVHPHFFERLQNRFIDLTSNELKLCAYLKMNLSTKEIARLSNITIPGVKKSRQRLRKKLGISAADSLVKFMNNI